MARFGGTRTRWIFAALVAAGGAAACGGGDGLAEGLLERQLENEAGVDGVEIDLETGEFRVETEDGTFELDADGDGGFSVQTEDGTFEQQAGTEVPDDFPGDVPRPDGTVVNAVRQTINGELSFSLFLQSDRSIEALYEPWKAQMLAAGFEASFESIGAGAITSQFADATWQVTFSGASDSSQATVQFNVFPVDA